MNRLSLEHLPQIDPEFAESAQSAQSAESKTWLADSDFRFIESAESTDSEESNRMYQIEIPPSDCRNLNLNLKLRILLTV